MQATLLSDAAATKSSRLPVELLDLAIVAAHVF
jgi:hypothetical protein